MFRWRWFFFNAHGINGYNWKICKKNYKYILLNNLAHESVGGQKTLIETLNLEKFSKAIGFKNYIKIDKKDSIEKS